MNRRQFLQSTAVLPLGVASATAAPLEFGELKRFKITRITGCRHVCPRPNIAGKNSHLDVHGRHTSEGVLRIATDQGIEGVGVGLSTTTPQRARQLIGHALDKFWRPGIGVVSPLDRDDHALYDLIGKVLNVPIWKLMGGLGPEWIPVYDGSIYFNDLLPQFQKQGVGRLLDEVESSLKAGHRAFKIKVGRGFKWMEKHAGFKRDVEVVRAIRKLAGKDVMLMADANNGFDLETTMRWLDDVGDELFFVEEMFPENVPDDRRLQAYFRDKQWQTLVADGESAREPDHFDPFIKTKTLDVLQPDIRMFGLTRQWTLSRKMAPHPRLKLAPHNWGSFLGLYMQLQLARGIPNFIIAEQDPSQSDLFDTSAFEFKQGKIRVPELSGAGLALRNDVFDRKYRPEAWVVE